MVRTLSKSGRKNLSLFLFITILISTFSLASAYYCIEQSDCCLKENDNPEVIQFKSSINKLALHQDITTHDLSINAFKIKLKYFNNCD